MSNYNLQMTKNLVSIHVESYDDDKFDIKGTILSDKFSYDNDFNLGTLSLRQIVQLKEMLDIIIKDNL